MSKLAEKSKELRTHSTKINAAMKSVENYHLKADDSRLIAAVLIAEAKASLKGSGVGFRAWCEKNLKISYETARKLAPIGQAEIEEEGAGKAMLTEMREKNRIANAEMRARKADDDDDDSDNDDDDSDPDPEVKRENRKRALLNIFGAMEPEDREEIVRTLAKEIGFKVSK